jgi:hypothetical protein
MRLRIEQRRAARRGQQHSRARVNPCHLSHRLLALLIATLSVFVFAADAATTITTNRFAYGANVGWLNFQADTNNGAVIGEFVCSGYVYSANLGWIHLGDGTPVNGVQYQNNSSTDYGVNHDGTGNLRGYAWGANVGWIQFESSGDPQVNLATGRLNGSAYSANCGWISLSNAFAHVQTGSIQKGADTDSDGIADAWELSHTNTLVALNGSGDNDSDGVSDVAEYLADTNPLDPQDQLRITAITHGAPTPTYTTLLWTSRPSRFYAVQTRNSLTTFPDWSDYFVFSSPGGSGLGFDQFSDETFYRIRAFRPLTP